MHGQITESWKPQKRDKTRRPLISVYIFIICMNFLILKFLKGHEQKKFDGMQINKHTPPILCYADDCIVRIILNL